MSLLLTLFIVLLYMQSIARIISHVIHPTDENIQDSSLKLPMQLYHIPKLIRPILKYSTYLYNLQ